MKDMVKLSTDTENADAVFYFEIFCKRILTKSVSFLLINLGYY